MTSIWQGHLSQEGYMVRRNQPVTEMSEGAKRVAAIIRRDVRRPNHLPVGNPLRFDMVWIADRMGWACPQGLHPQAPYDEVCGLLFGDDGDEFAEWWDAQENAQGAVDAVWG